MITRIVKMHFKSSHVDDFLELFASVQDKIRGFEGCQGLELLADITHTNIYFTYSHWESEAHLNAYRESDLFKKVWTQTKILFEEKAQAWSVERVRF